MPSSSLTRKTIKKCQKKYCKKMAEISSKIPTKLRETILKELPEKIKELENKPNKTKEDWKLLKERKKTRTLFQKLNTKTEKMRIQKINMQNCTDIHCNP